MKYPLKSSQRGISFLGLVVMVALGVSLFIVGAKVVPTVIEHQAALKAIEKAKAGNTVPEVRTIFDKAATIDDISSISGKDLDVQKVGDKVVVGYSYEREIHLAGPAYLTMKYKGQSR